MHENQRRQHVAPLISCPAPVRSVPPQLRCFPHRWNKLDFLPPRSTRLSPLFLSSSLSSSLSFVLRPSLSQFSSLWSRKCPPPSAHDNRWLWNKGNTEWEWKNEAAEFLLTVEICDDAFRTALCFLYFDCLLLDSVHQTNMWATVFLSLCSAVRDGRQRRLQVFLHAVCWSEGVRDVADRRRRWQHLRLGYVSSLPHNRSDVAGGRKMIPVCKRFIRISGDM